MDMYNSTGDAYRELARRTWLVQHGFSPDYDSPGRKEIDEKWVKVQRGKYKMLILSGLYMQSIRTLSKNAGLTYEEGLEVWNGFIGQMKKSKEMSDECLEYARKNKYYHTILGEKIPVVMRKVYTTSFNTVIQGFTAILLATFFYNCIERGMNEGIDVSSKMVIHDSQTIEFPINKLLHMDLICRKHFHQACQKYYLCNYKYDWDLLLDMKQHIPYQFDIENGIITLTLWSEKCDYFLDHLASSYKFKVIEKEQRKTNDEQGMFKLVHNNANHHHSIMLDERYLQNTKTDLKLQLTEPLKNVDFWSEPLPDTLEEYVHKIKWLEL